MDSDLVLHFGLLDHAEMVVWPGPRAPASRLPEVTSMVLGAVDGAGM
jgi:hypothetical protein